MLEPNVVSADGGGETTTPASSEVVYNGEKLKSIRESLGKTLEEISNRTKINTAILKALEEERYEDMPNARVYVRGFVRCLATELKLNEDEVSKTYLPGWERWFSNQSV